MTNYSDLHDVAHELQTIADKLRKRGQFKEEVNVLQANIDWLDQECLDNNTCPFCGGSLDVIEKNHDDCGFEVYRKCSSCGEEFV
ncbi:hypothetical protein [Holdemanella biformis]|jgi:hypothetical protein|uniref:hypothetical protein n=1 Tax=Holdemanella biformis TaxID=1735 RepID=UPI00205DDD44|nr:hypothetical protein [Holdemanella biformis]DAZ74206.1 MAG TPA: PhnA Zinc-Ribbon [Caudoviricetes sp.]